MSSLSSVSSSISQDNELMSILDRAIGSNHPLVLKAIAQEQTLRKRTAEDFCLLSTVLAAKRQEIDGDQFETHVKGLLEREVALLTAYNKRLEAPNRTLLIQMNTHKMLPILGGAQEIVATQNWPQESEYSYSSSLYDLTKLGKNETTLYGHSRNSFAKAALITGLVAAEEIETESRNLNIQAIDHLMGTHDSRVWSANTPFAHIVVAPEFFPKNSLFFYSDQTSPTAFAVVHSGYAFSGQREEARHDASYIFGPEDCSSWVSKLIGIKQQFSTNHLYWTHLSHTTDFPMTHEVYNELYYYRGAKENLNPVKINDPQTDVQPGQIWAVRKFKDAHKTGSGTSGHTALVLGMRRNGDVVTLGCGRNMPKVEGFGVQDFSALPKENETVMFFNASPPK